VIANRQEPIELECRPVLQDVICRFGEKCFHDVHYLCNFTPAGTTTPVCIPEDACVIDATIANLAITSVERSNGCARVCGNYDLNVFFRYDNQRLIGQAVRTDVPFCVQVPLAAVSGGCQEITCEGGNSLETEVCAFNTRLEVVEAVAEQDNNGANICEGCTTRIRVVVEKVFRAFEHGTQVVCLPVCPPEACEHVPTTLSPLCSPFSRPTECPSFCQDDEFFYPDWCDRCPPLPCIFLAIGEGSGVMPDDAIPEESRGGELSLNFVVCPICLYDGEANFRVQIAGEEYNLVNTRITGQLIAPLESYAEVRGVGMFGPENNRIPVIFYLMINYAENSFSFVIQDQPNHSILRTGANRLPLSRLEFREC